MKFDSLGLVSDNGSVDLKDSARLAGMLALFDHPQSPDLNNYFSSNGKPRRHPMYSPDDFSRDQMTCLAAGLWKQTNSIRIPTDYKPTNGDWLSPSQTDHLRRCCGLPDTRLGRAWFWCDILWSCFVDPLVEPNQLIAMLVIADKKYLKFWMAHNKDWRLAISKYWSNAYGSWRGEDEWAEFMISKLENI